MAANLGYSSLIIAFFLSIYSLLISIWGGLRRDGKFIESARLSMVGTFFLITLSMLCMIFLLINGHFDVQYVFTVVSNSMPSYLRLAALWGGQAGSLLFWVWLVSTVSMLAILKRRETDQRFLPWILSVFALTIVFFLSLSVFFENPFLRFWRLPDGSQIVSMMMPEGGLPLLPENGQGLNPLLRHPGMIFHPPMLYLGFVGFMIPFAYSIAALITGQTDDRWIRHIRRWTLSAWLFLSLGLVLGSRWAYDVLGWGGYWGWDPVEIAAFMPWLTGTAYIHSVIVQEKTSMFKRWNILLAILTYDLVILGTFLTRSGLLSSVHAFSESSIGPYFWGFITITLFSSIGLLLWRWNSLETAGKLDSLFSREVLFLFNNFLFMGIFLICLWGVLYPVIVEVFTGQKVTVGPPFYERATAPLFLALLFLMGIAPLSAWGHSTWKTMRRGIVKPLIAVLLVLLMMIIAGVRSAGALIGFSLTALVIFITGFDYLRATAIRIKQTGEPVLVAFWKLADRNRRRYGGYIVHLGVVLMALGIMGIELFQQETQGTVASGETLKLGRYSFVYKDLSIFDTTDGRNIARAVIQIQADEHIIDELYPRRDFFYESQQPVTVPGVHSSLDEDLYVVLVDWLPISSQGATFKVYRNPLINWLWIGSVIFMIGTLVAAWPVSQWERDRKARLAASLASRELG